MRKEIVTAFILVATYMSFSVAEVNTASSDDNLVFTAQARQGSAWLPLHNRVVNTAARACVLGDPRCYGYPNATCQPYAVRMEGAGGVREVQCIGALASPATAADIEMLQNNFNRAYTEAKGR